MSRIFPSFRHSVLILISDDLDAGIRRDRMEREDETDLNSRSFDAEKFVEKLFREKGMK